MDARHLTSGPVILAPEEIPWQTEHDDGTRSATLVGSREPGEIFTYAFFMPAGFYDPPHFHEPAIHLHVALGTLRIGLGGAVLELADYHQGAFLWLPPGIAHADGADTDTIIVGTAVDHLHRSQLRDRVTARPRRSLSPGRS